MQKLIFIPILIAVVIFPTFISAHQESSTSSDGGYGMMSQMGIMSGWGLWSWFGWIFPISIWVLMIVAIIALIKWLSKK